MNRLEYYAPIPGDIYQDMLDDLVRYNNAYPLASVSCGQSSNQIHQEVQIVEPKDVVYSKSKLR